ncbi:hypothetical protein M91_07724, partial [Bos mutus]
LQSYRRITSSKCPPESCGLQCQTKKIYVDPQEKEV